MNLLFIMADQLSDQPRRHLESRAVADRRDQAASPLHLWAVVHRLVSFHHVLICHPRPRGVAHGSTYNPRGSSMEKFGFQSILTWAVATAFLLAGCASKNDPVTQAASADAAKGIPAPSLAETKAIAEEAFIYGLPLVMNYAVM